MKKPLSLLLSLQLFFGPNLFAQEEPHFAQTHAEQKEEPTFKDGDEVYQVMPANELIDDVSGQVANAAGVVTHINSAEEVEENRPSKMAKIGNRAVNLTSQYVYFQTIMGLSAMVSLAMNYENDPVALQNYIKQYSSFSEAGKSVGTFGSFLLGDAMMTKMLRRALKMRPFEQSIMVQQIGMGWGLVVSSAFGEMLEDKNFTICFKSMGRNLQACDDAFDNWVTTNKIVKYIPMVIQNTASGLISAGITKLVHQGKLSLMAKRTAEVTAEAAAAEEKARKVEGKFLQFGFKAIKVGALTAAGPEAMVSLGLFMTVDAVISGPVMKNYTKNFIDEQDDVWSLRKLQKIVSTAHFYPFTWLTLNSYLVMSSMFPNYYPPIKDANARANWIKEFDLDTYAKFLRLWMKYNVGSRTQSKDLPWYLGYFDMMWPQKISGLTQKASIVEYPQDAFQIMKQSHEAVLSALDFEQKNTWQSYDISRCSSVLSKAAQLTFQEAMQFYIGINADQKQCLVNIGIYDNLVSYIDRSNNHRKVLLGPSLGATIAWRDGISKFIDMMDISIRVYRYLILSKYAEDHKQTSFQGVSGAHALVPLTYEGVNQLVKETEATLDGKNHEKTCPEGDIGCKADTEAADENFLPRSLWSVDNVGKIKVNNTTDYLLAQMACGPSTTDNKAYWDRMTSEENYASTLGRVFKSVSLGLDDFYKRFALSDGAKSPTEDLATPDSAMIYTPAGFYPRFIPPRIVTGNGDFCRSNSDKDQLVKYIVSHLQPILTEPYAKNPQIPNFNDWGKPIGDARTQTIHAFQSSFSKIMTETFAPTLKAYKFTDGCSTGQNCFRDWHIPKVSLGVYQSMDVELHFLLGLLNTIYLTPAEEEIKARHDDGKNSLSPSFGKPDDNSIRLAILTKEIDPKATPVPPMATIAPNYPQLQNLEIAFIKAFKSHINAKNTLDSFDVGQSAEELEALENFFTSSKISEISDLQARVSGLIFRALESVLQERNEYDGLLRVEKVEESKLALPQPDHKKGEEGENSAATNAPATK